MDSHVDINENGRVKLTVKVSPDLHEKIRTKLAAMRPETIQSVGEWLFAEWVEGAERPPKQIPEDLLELAKVIDQPRDFFEELMRDSIVRQIDALKKWRENESRRASGRP